jgi:hypothetical protein
MISKAFMKVVIANSSEYVRRLQCKFYFDILARRCIISNSLSCWNILCWWTKWFRGTLQIHFFLNELIKICCFVSIENFDKLQTKSYNGLLEFFLDLKKSASIKTEIGVYWVKFQVWHYWLFIKSIFPINNRLQLFTGAPSLLIYYSFFLRQHFIRKLTSQDERKKWNL